MFNSSGYKDEEFLVNDEVPSPPKPFFTNKYHQQKTQPQNIPKRNSSPKYNQDCIKTLFLIILCSIISFFSGLYSKEISEFFKTKNIKKGKIGNFGDLIFSDEFNGNSIDFNKWQHEISAFGGGNWEFEYYTNNRSNSYVKNGYLYIKPTLTNNTWTDPSFLTSGTLQLWGTSIADQCTSNFDYGCERIGQNNGELINVIQSARIRTSNSFSFMYGKIEFRAQLPLGDWLWPTIWLMPISNKYGDWPASGEIDLIEARCNYGLQTDANFVDGPQIGVNQMTTTLHWGPYYGADVWEKTHTHTELSSGYFSDSFHNWTIEWTPNGFVGSLDDVVYFNSSTPPNGYFKYGNFDTTDPGSFNPWAMSNNTNAPFDEVGGMSGFFPDGSVSNPQNGLPSYTKPWVDDTTTAMGDFWNARNSWYPTWNPFKNDGEDAAFKVDYIRVYEYQS